MTTFTRIWKQTRYVAIAIGLSFVTLAGALADPIKMATGPKDKGYSNVYADIAKVCPGKTTEVLSTGGLENVNLLIMNKAGIAITQLDTLVTMSQMDQKVGKLEQVLPLNYNYLHILSSSNGYTVKGAAKWGGISHEPDQTVYIQNFTQLRGKTVALVGSAQLLGRKLDRALGYGMQFVDVATDAEGIKQLNAKNVQAVFSLSGWPSGVVSKLSQSSGLTLVKFDAPIGAPYTVRNLTYQNLGVYGQPSLAVRNLIVTRPFTDEAAQQVLDLKACLVKNLKKLKNGDFEPAWGDIENTDENIGVRVFTGK